MVINTQNASLVNYLHFIIICFCGYLHRWPLCGGRNGVSLPNSVFIYMELLVCNQC